MKQRLINAAKFYQGEFRRAASKEREIAKGLDGNLPVISYLGWIGHNNLGDEILYDAHKALFAGKATIVPFRKSYIVKLWELFRNRQAYQAGFLGGGTLINQSTSWLEQLAYLEAKGLPLYCLGTGVTDPDFNGGSTNLAEWRKQLKRFKYVGVRGPYSLKMLKEAGFNKAEIVGDTALALADPTCPARPSQKVIGFNYGLVKENQIFGDTQSYTERIVASLRALIAEGYEIRLLPVWDRDIASNKQLLKLVDDPKCTMIEAFDSYEDYKRQLAECRLYIGQKLHASIMACMERMPTIMIEYNPKCRDFMASVDMEPQVVRTSEVTPELLLAKVAGLEQDFAAIQRTLDERVCQYRDRQFAQAMHIAASLKK